jgi:Domain of unknown function (DUF5076)
MPSDDPRHVDVQSIGQVQQDARAIELARVWAAGGCQHASLNVGVWSDPAAWGIMLVDLARHVASAYRETEGRDLDQTLARIKEGFETEWGYPTDSVAGGVIGEGT